MEEIPQTTTWEIVWASILHTYSKLVYKKGWFRFGLAMENVHEVGPKTLHNPFKIYAKILRVIC